MSDLTHPTEEPTKGLNLSDVWRTITRNRWLVLGVIAGTVALAALLTWRARPVYESGATLRIEQDDEGKSLLGGLAPLMRGGGREVIETEMIVLRSRQIVEPVVDSLALHVNLVEPARPRADVLSQVSAPRTATRAEYELEHARGGEYQLRVRTAADQEAKPVRVRVGVPFRVGDVEMTLNRSLAASPPERIVVRVGSFQETVRELRKKLRIARPNPDALIVSVDYQSTDPVLAAAVPDATAASFMRYKALASRSETGDRVTFLREQVAAYERELAGAESRLRGYREQQQVVSLADEASEQVKRLAELQAKRDGLTQERSALAGLLAQVRAVPRRDDGPSPYRQLASFPTFLSNRAVQDLLQSITEVENQRAQRLVLRTEENLDVQSLNTRIREMEGQLLQLAQGYLGSVDQQISSLDATLARFGSQLETIPAREVEFARLLREQGLLEELYKLLQTRLKEAEIQNAVRPSDVRVVDSAIVPLRPVSPRPMLNLLLACVIGTMLAVGAAFVREAMDNKVRTREDVLQMTGGYPLLGTIPEISARGAPAGTNRLRGKVAPMSAEEFLQERLVTRRDPRSPVSEAYRALRTNITYANIGRTPQVVVLTSAMPGDGKSTSSANLAITLAQQGVRTLLVDADLRRGTLHQVFGARQNPGLTQVLFGNAPLSTAVQQLEVGDGAGTLDFLSTGAIPPNPSELLSSPQMLALMAELRKTYELIILDAPPLNLVTDAALLGKVGDVTVLVTRAGITEKSALQQAASQLRYLQIPVGGVVLNAVKDGYTGYGYSYGEYSTFYDANSNGNGNGNGNGKPARKKVGAGTAGD